jgi:hypothetical protein
MKDEKKVMAVKNQDKDRTCCVNYWLCVIGLIIFMTCLHGREINRPFYGLHSWAQASAAWGARVTANYGFKYTKFIATWAVGNPPKANPAHYYDHPQLGSIVNGLTAIIFGNEEYVLRAANLVTNVIILLLFLKILKGLTDSLTALLAGIIYVIFPISCYFMMGWWPVVLGFGAVYFYLVIIGALKDAPQPSVRHKVGLALCLFIGLQFQWTVFFYAFGIGLHYVCRCLKNKKRPDRSLIAIMIIAPFASLAITFTIMAAGYGWDVHKIINLYVWRAGKGEYTDQMTRFDWSLWFGTLWNFALTNYSLPIVLASLVYFTIGQLVVFTGAKDQKTGRFKRQFPQFWLFFIPPVSQLFTLRGCLWRHQTWLYPFDPLIATAASLSVLLLFDLLKKVNFKVAVAGVIILLGIFTCYCFAGTNYYFDIRWQPEAKIKMFQMLNSRIPSDKYLLSFDPFIVAQHPTKGAFYRPEAAYYLDREITQAQDLEEVVNAAKTGKYPFYLLPLSLGNPQADAYVMNLSRQLQQLYKYEYIPGQPGEVDKKGRFVKAGMPSYVLFDLQSPLK